MAFFNELSGKIRNAGQSIAQSTKNLADVSRLKDNITSCEKQIAELYSVVGKGYYDRHKNDPNAEDKENINAINSLFNQISDLKQKIREIEGITRCPKCGGDIPKNAVFCNNCGFKITKDVQDVKKCPNCGCNVPQGALFCNNCGSKIPEDPKGKVCSKCGKPLAENSMFCANCGTKVEQEEVKIPNTEAKILSQTRCPACNTVLTEEDVFCPECGTPINQKRETERNSSETISANQEEV